MTASSSASRSRPTWRRACPAMAARASAASARISSSIPIWSRRFGRRFVHRAKISNAPQAIADVKYTDTGPIKDEIARFKKYACERLRRAVHDRAVARHRRDHADERALRLARGLRERARGADSQGVPRDPRGRTDPAGRRAGSRDGTRDEFPGRDRRGLRQDRRDASRGDQQGLRGHSGATAGGCTSAGATGKARTSTTSRSPKVLPVFYQTTAGALSIEFANPRHQHEYAAFKAHPFPKDKILIPGVIESTTQFRRAPGSGRAAHRGGGRGDRRPRARHRVDRLRLRHLRGPRMGRGERSCGRSSRPCARAPTLRRRGCGGRRWRSSLAPDAPQRERCVQSRGRMNSTAFGGPGSASHHFASLMLRRARDTI